MIQKKINTMLRHSIIIFFSIFLSNSNAMEARAQEYHRQISPKYFDPKNMPTELRDDIISYLAVPDICMLAYYIKLSDTAIEKVSQAHHGYISRKYKTITLDSTSEADQTRQLLALKDEIVNFMAFPFATKKRFPCINFGATWHDVCALENVTKNFLTCIVKNTIVEHLNMYKLETRNKAKYFKNTEQLKNYYEMRHCVLNKTIAPQIIKCCETCSFNENVLCISKYSIFCIYIFVATLGSLFLFNNFERTLYSIGAAFFGAAYLQFAVMIDSRLENIPRALTNTLNKIELLIKNSEDI